MRNKILNILRVFIFVSHYCKYGIKKKKFPCFAGKKSSRVCCFDEDIIQKGLHSLVTTCIFERLIELTLMLSQGLLSLLDYIILF